MRPLQGLAREERQAEEPAQPEPEPAADVMSLIERRWTITFDSEGRPRDVGEHADARALHNGWTTVEVIPAADARGAVEVDNAMVERLRESLWSTWGAGRQTTDWPTRAQLRAALDAAIGGQ
jgi:hypothetical protein